jgi:AraC-like DNA-binding protein
VMSRDNINWMAQKNNIPDFNFDLLNVGLAVHNSDWNWQDVWSPFHRIFYVVDGTAEVEFHDYKRQLMPGSLYLIPAFTWHCYHCDGHFELYYVHFYERPQSIGFLSNSMGDAETIPLGVFDVYETPTVVTAEEGDAALLERLCLLNGDLRLSYSDPVMYDNTQGLVSTTRKSRSHSVGNMMESRGILMQIVSRFMVKASTRSLWQDDRLMRAVGFIQRNITGHITVTQVADIMCTSNDNCIRIFRKSLGETTLQYINHKKMERAQLLLVAGNVRIKDLANYLGYDNFSYFTRLFRKVVGMSPTEFCSRGRRQGRDVSGFA